ncbi:hypothetical protein M0812_02560 [Anaeramoeba flamelloides]|uniref:Calcineurin-like phosphoesterase domain-containing protein n=1 Tax=Anaeramoeba flamelloides TaxID=1746091 RepID=A0AAV7YSI8_9EUKA|nr:hypothetical protein M0812_02560 [Anaeramoeba flamelloides]
MIFSNLKLLIIFLVFQATFCRDDFLKFNSDGSFKIVQFTDLHFSGKEHDLNSIQTQKIVLDNENPDFVVLTGDQISGYDVHTEELYKEVYQSTFSELIKRDLRWAMTFGNHDDQGIYTREQIYELDKTYDLSLTQRTPADIPGVTNYYIEIHTSDSTPSKKNVSTILYFLDSHDRYCEGKGGYGCITTEQILWFKNYVYLNQQKWPNHLGLVFFHIPVEEYISFWHNYTSVGWKFEHVCCPQINTGFYDVAKKMPNIKGFFVGHDHENDFCTRNPNEREDLWLCYGRKTGWGSYNPYPPQFHGARVIELHYDGLNTSWDSWIRDELGNKFVQENHDPDFVQTDTCPTAQH